MADSDPITDSTPLAPLAPPAVSLETMLTELESCTGADFTAAQTEYETYAVRAQLAVQNSPFSDRLFEIHEALSAELVAGKIAGIDHWASGASGFRTVVKSWPSLIDKLYRINREENELFSNPPIIPTVEEIAHGERRGALQRWITPTLVHEVVDDLVRTKFVVPFADGVLDVSDRITRALDDLGLKRFRRFHAKDTGYHARHYYALLEVPGDAATPVTTVTLEIKVLTKMQDQLGELTHLLYERHRTGALKLEKKRKVAWQFDSPDFLATYLGHSGHFLEAKICDLKNTILDMDTG